MNTGMALLGLLLGAGANMGAYFGVGVGWWLLGIAVVESIVFYLIARFTAMTMFGEVMRGWLIGMNAAFRITSYNVCYTKLLRKSRSDTV